MVTLTIRPTNSGVSYSIVVTTKDVFSVASMLEDSKGVHSFKVFYDSFVKQEHFGFNGFHKWKTELYPQ